MSWNIIIAAPQSETRLSRALEDAGVETFLPMKRTWRGRHARHAAIYKPLVPGYVFAKIEPYAVHAFHVDGAVRTIAVTHARTALDLAACLDGWRDAVATGLFDDPEPRAPRQEQRGLPPKNPRVRNRKTRRTKAVAVEWESGLKAILAALDSEAA